MSQSKSRIQDLKVIIQSHEAIAIAIFTAVSYLLAFSWERGYFAAYELPTEIVEVEIKTFFLLAASIGSILLYLIVGFDIIGQSLQKIDPDRHEFRYRMKLLGFSSVLCITPPLILMSPLKIFYYWLIPLITYSIFYILLPLLRIGKNAEEKWAKDDKKDTSYDYIIKYMGNWIAICVFITVIGCVYCYGLGYTWAASRTTFPVLEDTNEIALRIRSNSVILGEVDLNSRHLSGLFRIVALSDFKNIKFSNKKVGRLSVSRDKHESIPRGGHLFVTSNSRP